MRTRTAQNILGGVWLCFFVIQCALLVIRTVLGSDDPSFSSATNEMWKWYLPMMLPTISIILATIYASRQSNTKHGDAGIYGIVIAILLSTLYLLSVSGLLIMPPTVGLLPDDHLKLLHESVYWLGVLQLCVGASIGHFFGKVPAGQERKLGGSKEENSE
ncbi:hypothetical protein [Paraburkholderia sp. J11-2]|uniref:hypothetical protein n=1 Tax=Paraburkholderia sp. J11-2 TaxID=2805431 RepID=UPI002AB5E11F|nr:hypothetical protein [Paraburkholderia sp. J11-2]